MTDTVFFIKCNYWCTLDTIEYNLGALSPLGILDTSRLPFESIFLLNMKDLKGNHDYVFFKANIDNCKQENVAGALVT